MAKKVYIDFELRYKEAVANLDEMQKEYSKLEKQVDKTTESQEELGNILDSTTGGAITKFKSLRGTIGNVVKSFKNLRVAILATGVGALVLAIGSLVAMFKNSEEGQNRFAKLMTQIGVVTGNVIDIVADFGNVMFNVFTGNFKAAGEALNEVTEGIKNFGEETRKEIAIAGELSDLRAKADKQQRELIVERAEADRKRAELLEQSVNKEKFTVQERIEFLKEAGKVEQDITNKEIEAAKLRLQAKQAENELSGSTKEDLDEEANLKAELIRLEQARLTRQKEVTGQIIAFTAEEAAARKALLDQQRAAEKEFAENNFFIPGVGFVSEETFTLLKARQDEETKKQKEADAQAAADQVARLEKEKQIEFERRKQKEQTFRFAVELAGSETRLGRALLLAKQVLLAREAIMNFKANVVNATAALGGVTLTASEAAVETTASIAKAANVAPPPFNLPFILTALSTAATVMSAVKAAKGKTQQVASGLGAGGVGGGVNLSTPSISTPTVAESLPPQFNLAGGGGANALASALGEQQQAPIQAFVVSGDVSTAQELERNIITGATLG